MARLLLAVVLPLALIWAASALKPPAVSFTEISAHNFTLNCSSDATNVTLSWLRSGKEELKGSQGESPLILDNATSTQDYVCRATDPQGNTAENWFGMLNKHKLVIGLLVFVVVSLLFLLTETNACCPKKRTCAKAFVDWLKGPSPLGTDLEFVKMQVRKPHTDDKEHRVALMETSV